MHAQKYIYHVWCQHVYAKREFGGSRVCLTSSARSLSLLLPSCSPFPRLFMTLARPNERYSIHTTPMNCYQRRPWATCLVAGASRLPLVLVALSISPLQAHGSPLLNDSLEQRDDGQPMTPKIYVRRTTSTPPPWTPLTMFSGTDHRRHPGRVLFHPNCLVERLLVPKDDRSLWVRQCQPSRRGAVDWNVRRKWAKRAYGRTTGWHN